MIANTYNKDLSQLMRISLELSGDSLDNMIESELNAVKSELNKVKSELNAVKSELNAVKFELNTTKSKINTNTSKNGHIYLLITLIVLFLIYDKYFIFLEILYKQYKMVVFNAIINNLVLFMSNTNNYLEYTTNYLSTLSE